MSQLELEFGTLLNAWQRRQCWFELCCRRAGEQQTLRLAIDRARGL